MELELKLTKVLTVHGNNVRQTGSRKREQAEAVIDIVESGTPLLLLRRF
jgi:hypothetical protein